MSSSTVDIAAIAAYTWLELSRQLASGLPLPMPDTWLTDWPEYLSSNHPLNLATIDSPISKWLANADIKTPTNTIHYTLGFMQRKTFDPADFSLLQPNTFDKCAF